MSKRGNHYEAAFERFLRNQRIPYVAVDETCRSLSAEGSIKSLDFIVSPADGPCSWLVDVKGRRFPSGRQRRYWTNWSTCDDIHSMARWEQLSGPRFCGLLVFAYNVAGDRASLAREQLLEFRGGLYGFVPIRLVHYAARARRISPKWQMVAMPSSDFRALAEPAFAILTPHQSAT